MANVVVEVVGEKMRCPSHVMSLSSEFGGRNKEKSLQIRNIRSILHNKRTKNQWKHKRSSKLLNALSYTLLALPSSMTTPSLSPTSTPTPTFISLSATTTSLSGDPIHVISSALSEALVHYYPLAGTLRRRKDHRLENWCSTGKGVPLIRAAADVTLDSVNYLDGPDFGFSELLVPDPGSDEGLEHPCMLQVTVFMCGGFTLGAAMHHAICGMGGGLFFNTVAELARGSTRISMDPVWDREKLLVPRNPPRVESPMVREFLSLEKGSLPYQEDIGEVVRECFHIQDDCLDGFKKYLFEQSGLNFTSFEALGAYIWRSKLRASGIFKSDEKVKFAYSINIRRLVKPPLPPGYWGNGCVPMYVQLSVKDLIERPIWETAEQIKKSKSNVNDEYIRSFIDFQELH